MEGRSYTSLFKTLDNPSSTQTEIPSRGPITSLQQSIWSGDALLRNTTDTHSFENIFQSLPLIEITMLVKLCSLLASYNPLIIKKSSFWKASCKEHTSRIRICAYRINPCTVILHKKCRYYVHPLSYILYLCVMLKLCMGTVNCLKACSWQEQ